MTILNTIAFACNMIGLVLAYWLWKRQRFYKRTIQKYEFICPDQQVLIQELSDLCNVLQEGIDGREKRIELQDQCIQLQTNKILILKREKSELWPILQSKIDLIGSLNIEIEGLKTIVRTYEAKA